MEDTLQRIFSILLSVMIFFLLPLYMAFEKKDDIAYSLALKITSNFVDEVCNKGYMTIDMYNDFVSELNVTGNSYDISLEHVSKVYNPVIYAYKDGKQYSFDYNLYKRSYNANNKSIKVDNVDYINATLSYKVDELKYSTDQILRVMDQDSVKKSSSILNRIDYTYDENTKKYNYSKQGLNNLKNYQNIDKSDISPISELYRIYSSSKKGYVPVYSMNKGDTITIVIKNTNVTIASILFNTLTFGAKSGADTKVYINYGGTIKNEEYRQTAIDTTVIENSTNIEEEKNLNLQYDLNLDGYVSIKDYKVITQYLVSGNGNYEENKQLDLNNDGSINSSDNVIAIKKFTELFDLNGDNELNGKDTYIVQMYLAGYTYSENIIKRMDANNDNQVNTQDLILWISNIGKAIVEAEEDVKEESCAISGHEYIPTELKDCNENIKNVYNFIGIVNVDRYGNYTFPLNAKVGDIFIAGYYGSGNYERITSVKRGYGGYNSSQKIYNVQSLGATYKIDVCSKCGEYVR